MAQRKKPETKPTLTADEQVQQDETNAVRTTRKLPEKDFQSVIRFLRTATSSRVETLWVALEEVVERYKLKINKRKAADTTPKEGEVSDHVDVQTLVTWAKSLDPTKDGDAINQLLVFAATCQARLK